MNSSHVVAYSVLRDDAAVDEVFTDLEGYHCYYIPRDYAGFDQDELIEVRYSLLASLCPDLPKKSILRQTGGASRTGPGVWEPDLEDDPTDIFEPAEPILVASKTKPRSPFRVSRNVLLGEKPAFLVRIDNAQALLGYNDMTGADDFDVVDISATNAKRIFPPFAIQVKLKDGAIAYWSGNSWKSLSNRSQVMATNGLVWTTSAISKGRSPVLIVQHEEDGEWQYLDGKSTRLRMPRLVHLQHLTERDPTLLDIPRLSPGEYCIRGSADSPWRL